MLLILAVAALVLAVLPAIRRKREVVFEEEAQQAGWSREFRATALRMR